MATLLACVGLLIQVVGYALGWRGDEAAAIGLWYMGFVGIVVPFALAAARPAAGPATSGSAPRWPSG